MKDIFDECSLGDLKLKSRIVRTGTWERATENGGFLKSEVFNRYEHMAKSGVGLINSEMFVFDPRDRFAEYCNNVNYKGFVKDYKEINDMEDMKKYAKAEEDLNILMTAVNMTISSFLGAEEYANNANFDENCEDEGSDGCTHNCATCRGCH